MAREGENFPVFSAGSPSLEKLLGFAKTPGSGLIKASSTVGKTPKIPGLTKVPKQKVPKIPKPKIPKGVVN